MTRQWWIWALVAALMALAAVTACGGGGGGDDDDDDDAADDDDDDDDSGDDDDDSVIGPADDPEAIPAEALALFTGASYDDIVATGFTVYAGNGPPNIQSTFLINNSLIVYERRGAVSLPEIPTSVGTYEDDFLFTFLNQLANGHVDITYVATDDDELGNGGGAFISGWNGCFTTYLEVETEQESGLEDPCVWTSVQMLSGCLTTAGITNTEWAIFVKTQTPECNYLILPNNSIRIIDDEDGLSEYYEE
ncbi:hypothetical protein KDL45_07410 [bacterium]|nr:hypothetical protein [bacterium]